MTAAVPGARPGTGDADLDWHRPSKRLLRARRIEVALVTVPLALIGGFAGGTVPAAIGLIVALRLVSSVCWPNGSWRAASPRGGTPSGTTT